MPNPCRTSSLPVAARVYLGKSIGKTRGRGLRSAPQRRHMTRALECTAQDPPRPPGPQSIEARSFVTLPVQDVIEQIFRLFSAASSVGGNIHRRLQDVDDLE